MLCRISTVRQVEHVDMDFLRFGLRQKRSLGRYIIRVSQKWIMG